ncbi:MAG: hypothetical protein HY912_00140 [Desulfomonile tiedjei]|uniref:SH3 domain-containing protein n=1 Tax=Desulfomonile tiedjei TaxID=2358 RepID=A0A9D6UYB0_9BACT|nr:hypothetical protein [Desulfomonile tiedjei]
MNAVLRTTGILVMALCLWVLQSGESTADPYTGPPIGPMTATIIAGDDQGGLMVRSSPSQDAPVLGVLAIGSRVINYPRFENGWVMLQSPMNGGWVRIDSLEAVRGVATVAGVDRPEMCLRIRTGPGVGYDMVGCARMNERLRLTGFWSQNNWIEIEGPLHGWVSSVQIRTNLNVAASSAPAPVATVVRETVVPVPYAYPVPRRYPAYYGYPSYRYSSYWYPNRGRSGYRYPYEYGGFRYRGSGVGVAVGPRGGVGVRVGPVGVGVGPGGGVAVRAGGVRVRVR